MAPMEIPATQPSAPAPLFADLTALIRWLLSAPVTAQWRGVPGWRHALIETLRQARDDDGAEPALIAEFKVRFRTLELRRETKRGTSVYNGIFNLLVLRGARDWMTGNVPQHGDLDDHHIVPKSWGKEHGLTAAVDSILNRTPLTADTNRRVIKNRLPNAYLPELIAENGEAGVRATLASHLITPAAFNILLRTPFGPDDLAPASAAVSARWKAFPSGVSASSALPLVTAMRQWRSRSRASTGAASA